MAYQESLKTSRFLLWRLLGVSHLCLHTESRHQRLEPGHLRSHHGRAMREDERCPLSATKVRESVAELDPVRCLGWSVCVTKCEAEAIRLLPAPASDSELPRE